MNKAELIQYMETPATLGKQQVSALKQVAADFPYFQGAGMLISKALSNLNHYEFEKQLHKTALSVPNREVLYRFIHQIEAPVAKPAEPVVVNTPEVVLEQTVPAIEKEISEVLETVHAEVPAEPEVIEPVVTLTDEPLVEEQTILTEAIIAPVEIPPVVDVAPAEETAPVLEIQPGEEHTFAEWLKLAGGKHIEVPAPVENKQPETPIEPVKEELPQEPVLSTPEPPVAPVSPLSNVGNFESILDKFIRESPSISRPKADFYKPANMAKQSVEEDEDLVTETLARLYYNQGHYKKAIRAYEKLCLIYPHKMAYFADLIQKIKQETKD